VGRLRRACLRAVNKCILAYIIAIYNINLYANCGAPAVRFRGDAPRAGAAARPGRAGAPVAVLP